MGFHKLPVLFCIYLETTLRINGRTFNLVGYTDQRDPSEDEAN